MSPEIWALVARELNSITQLSRDSAHAAKIARHAERLRQLMREATNARADSRRAALWWRDPACLWCGRVTRLDHANGAPLAATLDHLKSGPGRDRQRDMRRHLPATVLACYECNHRRGQPPPPVNPMCPLLRARR